MAEKLSSTLQALQFDQAKSVRGLVLTPHISADFVWFLIERTHGPASSWPLIAAGGAA